MTPAVVSLSGHFLAIDKIIPLNAERPRNLRRAFGTAPEENGQGYRRFCS
jgi:hypothetical protein